MKHASVMVLVLEGAFAIVGLGVRTLVEWRRGGDSGWRLGRDGRSLSRLLQLALPLVAALAVAAPVADLAGLSSVSVFDRAPLAVLGVALVAAGAVLSVVAQFDMGRSWRIGVDERERTELVTGGLFRWVRNPIYTGLVALVLGLLLAVPNWLAVAALVLAVVAVEIQVRWIEEPLLVHLHATEYSEWARHAGRFLPGVGRLSARA